MRDKTTQAAGRDNGSPLAGVKRLELLSWRFSQTEIVNLSLLQLVHRQQPNVLDIPLEESRLQFARWLVEHGRLSEGMAPASEETLCAPEEKYPSPDRANAPMLPCGSSLSMRHRAHKPNEPNEPNESGEPEAEDIPQEDAEESEDAESGRRVRRAVWTWLRRGMTKFAACWRELTRPDYMPYGPGNWGTWGYYGAYDPYGPRNPWGDPRGISDPYWYWMHYRHDN